MKNKRLFLLSAFLVIIGTLKAQNPIITDQFTADPTAKDFEGKMYVYPSHDNPRPIERLKWQSTMFSRQTIWLTGQTTE